MRRAKEREIEEREKRACSGPVGAWESEWSREVGLG